MTFGVMIRFVNHLQNREAVLNFKTGVL